MEILNKIMGIEWMKLGLIINAVVLCFHAERIEI